MPTEGEVLGSFRVTTVGSYHVNKVVRQFTYLDGMIVDTPILDAVVRKRVHDVDKIEDRLRRGIIFLGYLDQEWERAGFASVGFEWGAVSQKLREGIGEISDRIGS